MSPTDLQAAEQPDGQSVLFLLSDVSEDYALGLSAAQEAALHYHLPLAVVACAYSPSQETLIVLLKKFLPLEKILSPHDIPLLVLLGKPNKVLGGLFAHLRPKKIVTSAHTHATTLNLQTHLYPWPGKVIPVAELIEIVRSGVATC